MKRRLFNLLAGVSLLVCVATVTLWVRTCSRRDQIQLSDRQCAFSTNPHRITFSYSSRPYFTGISYSSGPVNYGFSRQFGPFWGFTKIPAPSGASYAALGFFIYRTFRPSLRQLAGSQISPCHAGLSSR